MYIVLLNEERLKKRRKSTQNYHLGQNLNTERSQCETAAVTMQ